MKKLKLTKAQARILREAERLCGYEPSGSRIKTCERLVELGMMRRASFITFRVTREGRAWLGL